MENGTQNNSDQQKMGDTSVSKKEAYVRMREEKKEARKKDAGYQGGNMRRWKLWSMLIVVVGGLGYGGWWMTRSLTPSSPDQSIAYDIIGREHIPEDSSHPSYNSNPPTSGPHYAIPARLGVYDKELPDERIIHNLEHGEIWISYNPRIPEDAMQALRSLLTSRVIITPRSANDTDIAVAAWGRLDAFNLDGKPVDTTRISDFIKRYQNRGPEHLSSDTMVPGDSEEPIITP